MRLNKIHGAICIKSTNNPNSIIERTVKMLRQNKFLTEHIENRIIFQRSVQFTTDTGKNKLKVFLFSYNGVINILNNKGDIIYDYSLNINAQLIKLSMFILLLYLVLYFYNTNVHPLLLVLILILLIFFQRALLKNHFINIIKQ